MLLCKRIESHHGKRLVCTKLATGNADCRLRARTDENLGRNRCMAPANQRCGEDTGSPRGRRAVFGIDHRISDTRRLRLRPPADLSGLALRIAKPSRNRTAHPACGTGRDPRRHRRSNWVHGSAPLPEAGFAVHHQFHDAVSGIYRRPRPTAGQLGLCRAAAFSRRCGCDHGLDPEPSRGARPSAALHA